MNSTASILAVELFFEEAPSIPRPVLREKLEQYCPGLVELEGNRASNLLAFQHPAYTSPSEEGVVPAQYLITPRQKPLDLQLLQPAIRQSWAFPEAPLVLAGCRHSLVVSDYLCSGLAYPTRLKLFQGIVRAAIEAVACRAVHWVTAQHILPPEAYLNQLPSQGDLTGALHVRLFQVTGSETDHLVDTVGLWAFGLPDVECRFQGLDPTQVANHVYGVAAYIFEKGDVIQEGHTVTGVPSTVRWTCRRRESTATPDRQVLHLAAS